MIKTKRQPATWKALLLPHGDRVILASEYESNGAALDLYDTNHNVYRLDPAGNIVWQVQRDDSNQPPDWWEVLHRYAREEGRDGAREPFTYIQVAYADGSTSWDKSANQWLDICEWRPGCTIWLAGSAYQQYILDPETGIAKNVTEGRPRPW